MLSDFFRRHYKICLTFQIRSTLFDLSESDNIFRTEGAETYR
ncbi:hypothetical protein NEIPOLOT_02461 [Neisseria polysaccharea ATCC 43768]|nr:hypothetical protein NEIPOLOT_02461 [Neisseria polysaccharea ATCC 43768]